ncbi:polysaccharide biosynthesis tyrosine autokinase [Antarcticibacterium sp. 1MA-6-2]|uniref:GumC family protein n=1 Tax=Antarcticibacterium sp. 1MA-6-2 TaxID=2908210 RepID=UPI001F3E8C81|nr:tyrosine-protein kinase family protein [Antarcticibacterium sp. 1MA-6-2]UJH91752.1 polysaccharide biosynthesis tyrosine autokinase [Antarcticibacterium sp. 1MA-6-2]
MNYNSKNSREDSLFRVIIQTFLPFWPLFLILIVGSLISAWAYLRIATPIYEASASIIIKDEQKGVDDSRIVESMNPFESKKIVENEIEVLQSRDLMNSVVRSLYLYSPVQEDAGMKSKPAYTSSPIRIIVKEPERIEISNEPEKFSFNYDNEKEEVLISGERYGLDNWIEFSNGQTLMFVKNDRRNKSTSASLYFNLVNPKIISEGLVDGLDVKVTNKLSSVVNLSIKDPVPERAEDILDNLIKEYNRKIVEDRKELALNTLAFIEDRIESVEKDLDQLENNVEEYRSSAGAINLSEQGRLYLQDVGENDKQITELELQLAVLNNVENYVISKGSTGGIVPSTLGINDPILSQLIEKLYNLEVEYERLKRTTAENNPILTSITNQIEKIRPGILENVNSQRQNLKSRLNNLNSNNQRFNSTLSNIPEKERTLLEITRRKTVKNDLFSYLLQKREETALSNIPSNENSTIVNKAEASISPVSPKPLFAYVVAFCVAVVTGIGFVKGREVLSGAVLFRSEIEKYTDIPIIAEIFHVKTGKSKRFQKPQEFILIEQLRQLGARLGLYRRDFKQRRILITSGISGEGKSFVSSNLAYSFAQSGKKVVLVDMDFRKPYVSELFDLSASKGIIGFLKNEINYKDTIHPSGVHPNLSVVSTGARGDDYSEILLNGKLEILMEALSEDFEYVILDSAPINVLAEVNLLAEYSDKTLYVVRHGHTSKEAVKRLDESTSLQSLKNVSIVFNGLKTRGMVKTDYGYGYDLKHMMNYTNQKS